MYLLGYTVIHTWEHVYHHKRLEALIVCHSWVNSCFLHFEVIDVGFPGNRPCLVGGKRWNANSAVARSRAKAGGITVVHWPMVCAIHRSLKFSMGRVAFCGYGWGEKSHCMQISLVYKEWTTWLKCFGPWILFPRMGLQTNTESHCVVVLVVVVVDLLTRSPTKITTQRESGDSSIEFWELGS